jgi:macrolide transport system ATP-binding/permease protein
MSLAQGWWLRLRSLFRREQVTRELDREIQFHLDQQIAENIALGMSPAEARSAALRIFGNTTAIKENTRETWGWTWVEQLVQDLRFAIRQLRKSPGFTATAALTLALGIGANTAIFTLVHAVMMRNLPVADPKTLVRIGDVAQCCVSAGAFDDGKYAMFSTEAYDRLRKNVPEFEELAAIQAGYEYRPVVTRRDGSGEAGRAVMGEFVSGNYFRTFGLTPSAGRLFGDEDNSKGAPVVAVMSYTTWMSRYAGDPSVVGGTFFVNTKPVTIVGIAPRGFFGDRLSSAPPELYLPFESMPSLANVTYVHDPGANWLYIIGRMKSGAQLGVAQAKVHAIVRQALAETQAYSGEKEKKILDHLSVVLTPGGAGIQNLRAQYEQNLRMLMGAAGLVLLIACANIANLLLARGMKRKNEMSVRSALGAPRERILRQLMTESVVLAGLGGLLALVVAYFGTRMLLALTFPAAQGMPIVALPSPAVLTFACGLSLLTGILFGVAPAWIAAQTDPADALRSGMRGTTTGSSLLQKGLVVAQAALSVVLLVGAGLFAQNLQKLESSDMKLDPKNRYIVHINPQTAGYSQTDLDVLYRTIESRFHAIPGVVKVGLASYTPMEDNNNGWGIQREGHPETATQASFIRANAEYFDSVGTKVVMGRGILEHDTPTSATIAVINETLRRKLFKPDENPLGTRIGPGQGNQWQVVGVVEDTAYQDVTWKDHGMLFVPAMQRAADDKRPLTEDENLYLGGLVIETSGRVNDMEQLARKTLADINPNLAVVKFQTFDAQIADQFIYARMVARLTGLFGGLALLLATIGLYGVTSYTVARRSSEIGIRMALGARRSGVVGMVMRGAMSQTFIGLAIGIPAALLCARVVESQLYDVKNVNAAVMLLAVFALALASALAGLIPATGAASTEPARTLRAE